MRPVDRGPQPTRPGGAPRHYASYTAMRIDLISRIGEYCSYCEMPLGVNLAIEHMLSKSWSINDIDWNNSLLACTNCNSHKRDQTTSESSLDDYCWPSVAYPAPPVNTFDMLAYVRDSRTPQSLVTDGLLALPASRARRPYVTQAVDAVWVTVNPAYAATPGAAAIKRTIVLTGLNDYVPPDENPKVSDRRIAHRTRAWDAAVAAAGHLSTYGNALNLAQAQASVPVRLLLDQTRALVLATGFWSTWLTVFLAPSLALGPADVRAWLVCELFVKPFAGTRLPVAGLAACP